LELTADCSDVDCAMHQGAAASSRIFPILAKIVPEAGGYRALASELSCSRQPKGTAMDKIVAKDGEVKSQAGAAVACGHDCSTCPKKLTCPLSPFAVVKSEGGRT
jgi:hypothetical protein